MPLTGGSALRARLTNVKAVGETFTRDWADATAEEISRTKPHSTRPASSRFTTRASRTRGAVYGAFWWLFVDRGTKAHDIVARKAKALRWENHGETIFARKVHVGRIRRRPFISAAAQKSLHEMSTDAIVQAWNGRRRVGKASHSRFL